MRTSSAAIRIREFCFALSADKSPARVPRACGSLPRPPVWTQEDAAPFRGGKLLYLVRFHFPPPLLRSSKGALVFSPLQRILVPAAPPNEVRSRGARNFPARERFPARYALPAAPAALPTIPAAPLARVARASAKNNESAERRLPTFRAGAESSAAPRSAGKTNLRGTSLPPPIPPTVDSLSRSPLHPLSPIACLLVGPLPAPAAFSATSAARATEALRFHRAKACPYEPTRTFPALLLPLL